MIVCSCRALCDKAIVKLTHAEYEETVNCGICREEFIRLKGDT